MLIHEEDASDNLKSLQNGAVLLNNLIENIDNEDMKTSKSNNVGNNEHEPSTTTQKEPDKIGIPNGIEKSIRLSNNLDILSDDEEPVSNDKSQNSAENAIQAEDGRIDKVIHEESRDKEIDNMEIDDLNTTIETSDKGKSDDRSSAETIVEIGNLPAVKQPLPAANTANEKPKDTIKPNEPLIKMEYVRLFKTKIAKMSRDDMEEFILLKLVEGIAEKSELSDIKSKLKTMQDSAEEWRKKGLLLMKQCRDLQVVLKTVQEEHKKRKNEIVAPLRITRSVGLQVLMQGAGTRPRPANFTTPTKNKVANNNVTPQPTAPTSRVNRKPNIASGAKQAPSTLYNKPVRNTAQANQITKPAAQNHPAPKKKAVSPQTPVKQQEKKPTEKRPIQSIDLTDDEPPAKTHAMSSPTRAVTPNSNNQNNKTPTTYVVNNTNVPLKPVYSAAPSPAAPAGTVVYKSQNQLGLATPPPLIRQRMPTLVSALKTGQPTVAGHVRLPIRSNVLNIAPSIPPLPFAAKQLSNPSWKKLPPKPELKISKADNGIVISWIMDVVMNESYEEIASYQIYAYQETSEPQKSSWKKIGDVKALPLPMACTLTQFSTGYKYFFAVRAVDVRSRVGPFSAPGSILLITNPSNRAI